MNKFSRKTLVVSTAAVLLLGGGAAYAYWTTTGSGTGTAVVGTSLPIIIHGEALTPLTLDGATSAVTFTADNPSTGTQRVTTVSLVSVAAFSDPGRTVAIPTGTGAGNCDVTKFTMPDVSQDQDLLAAASGTALTNDGILSLANDPAYNQDACKNAYLTLNLTSS